MLGIIVVEAWGLVAMLRNLRSEQVLRLLTYRDSSRFGWIAGTVVALLFIATSAKSLSLSLRELLSFSQLKVLAIPFAFFAGALEELLFRRVIMDALLKHGSGWLVQIVMSALLFAAAHVIWGVFGGWKALISALTWTSGLGGLLAVTYLAAGRDVAPCIWAHVAIDLVIEPCLLLTFVRRGITTRVP
jgi:membrane protease YdiL (CAAX protease family)